VQICKGGIDLLWRSPVERCNVPDLCACLRCEVGLLSMFPNWVCISFTSIRIEFKNLVIFVSAHLDLSLG